MSRPMASSPLSGLIACNVKQKSFVNSLAKSIQGDGNLDVQSRIIKVDKNQIIKVDKNQIVLLSLK